MTTTRIGAMSGTGQTVVAHGAVGTLSSIGNKFVGHTLEHGGTVTFTESNLPFNTNGIVTVDDVILSGYSTGGRPGR